MWENCQKCHFCDIFQRLLLTPHFIKNDKEKQQILTFNNPEKCLTFLLWKWVKRLKSYPNNWGSSEGSFESFGKGICCVQKAGHVFSLHFKRETWAGEDDTLKNRFDKAWWKCGKIIFLIHLDSAVPAPFLRLKISVLLILPPRVTFHQSTRKTPNIYIKKRVIIEEEFLLYSLLCLIENTTFYID